MCIAGFIGNHSPESAFLPYGLESFAGIDTAPRKPSDRRDYSFILIISDRLILHDCRDGPPFNDSSASIVIRSWRRFARRHPQNTDFCHSVKIQRHYLLARRAAGRGATTCGMQTRRTADNAVAYAHDRSIRSADRFEHRGVRTVGCVAADDRKRHVRDVAARTPLATPHVASIRRTRAFPARRTRTEAQACRKRSARLDCFPSLGSSLLSAPGKRTRQHTRPAAVARSA